MTYADIIAQTKTDLQHAQALIQQELCDYPTPVSGCDAQYNYLIGQRGAVSEALRALQGPRFVATPRTPTPDAGIESR